MLSFAKGVGGGAVGGGGGGLVLHIPLLVMKRPIDNDSAIFISFVYFLLQKKLSIQNSFMSF